MAKADVVLVVFPFTDLSGTKLRPAVVLVETDLDLTVSFITSQTQWQDKTDILLIPNAYNGLKKQSLLRLGKIATLDKSLVKGLLGNLTHAEVVELDKQLKALFQLT